MHTSAMESSAQRPAGLARAHPRWTRTTTKSPREQCPQRRSDECRLATFCRTADVASELEDQSLAKYQSAATFRREWPETRRLQSHIAKMCDPMPKTRDLSTPKRAT